MTVSGGEESSLLSYIRLLEINPHSMSANPYYDMSVICYYTEQLIQ